MPKNKLHKNANKRLVYQVTENGEQIKITQRKNESRTDFLKRCDALDGKNIEASKVMFSQAYDDWYTQHVQRNCSPAYAEQVSSIYEQHIKAVLGFRMLTDILPSNITLLFGTMRDNGLSDWTIKHTRKVISCVYNYTAKQHDWTDIASPTRNIQIPRKKQYDNACLSAADASTSVSDSKVMIVCQNDLQRLVDASKRHKSHYAFAWQFYAETGLRKGELIPLKWSDISNGDTLSVRWSITKYGKSTTKTPTGKRDIPLSPMALELLDKQREYLKSIGLENSEYIFPNMKGKASTSSALQSALQRAVKHSAEYEIIKGKNNTRKQGKMITPPVNVNFLDLRHTFATNLAPYVTPHVLAAIMGHADIETTMKYYIGTAVEQIDVARKAMLEKAKNTKQTDSNGQNKTT